MSSTFRDRTDERRHPVDGRGYGRTVVWAPGQVILEINGVNGPGRDCDAAPDHGPYLDVLVGVGRFTDPIGVVSGDTESVVWRVSVRVTWREGKADFHGPQVDGRGGDRHVYLDWFNREANGELKLFRRGKVMLAGIDPALVKHSEQSGRALRCTVNLTNERGLPSTARFWAPSLAWRLGGDDFHPDGHPSRVDS
jgi:hypothetical protein